MTPRLPNFFILGAPKCGTTSLASWLDKHPEIWMAKPKEPMYFNSDLGSWSEMTAAEYRSRFSQPGAAVAVRGEASTHYLFSEVAVSRIESSIENARYLVLVRHPLDMAISLHRFWLRLGWEHLPALRDAWEASDQRRTGHNVSSLVPEPKLLDYRRMCALGAQVDRLIQRVPSERLLILDLNRVSLKPAEEYKRVLRFLQTDDVDFLPEFERQNVGRIPRDLRLHRTLWNVGGYLHRTARRVGLPTGTGLIARLRDWNTDDQRDDAIDEDLVAEMSAWFADDLRVLESLVGHRVPSMRTVE